MREGSSSLFGHFPASVIASSLCDIGVPRCSLHGGDVGTGIKQVGDEGSSEVVWTRLLESGLLGAAQENIHHALVGEAAQHDAPAHGLFAFEYGQKQRLMFIMSDRLTAQPLF
jgi:hypothetical protein